MPRAKDTQRQKVIEALAEVVFAPLPWNDASLAAQQLLDSKWWLTQGGPHSGVVFIGKATSCMARYRDAGFSVEIPHNETTSALDVVHSLVHLLDHHLDRAYHGPEFCARMLDAAQAYFSADTAAEIQEAFISWGVRTSVPTEAEVAATAQAKVDKEERSSANLEKRLRTLLTHLEQE